eukprot:UN24464
MYHSINVNNSEMNVEPSTPYGDSESFLRMTHSRRSQMTYYNGIGNIYPIRQDNDMNMKSDLSCMDIQEDRVNNIKETGCQFRIIHKNTNYQKKILGRRKFGDTDFGVYTQNKRRLKNWYDQTLNNNQNQGGGSLFDNYNIESYQKKRCWSDLERQSSVNSLFSRNNKKIRLASNKK